MPKQWSETIIENRFKNGCGQGEKEGYAGWLSISDFSSIGSNRERIPGNIIQRPYHLKGEPEQDIPALRRIELHHGVHDIKEYFPIKREITLAIADNLEMTHPCYPETKIPEVLCITFLVSIKNNSSVRKVAVMVCRSHKLEQKAFLEKIEIIRLACSKSLNCSFKIITEKEIDKEISFGIDWANDVYHINPDHFPGVKIPKIKSAILKQLSSYPQLSINEYCKMVEGNERVPSGVVKTIMRSMIANNELKYDFFARKLSEHTMLSDLSI